MYQAYWGLEQSPFTAAAARAALVATPVHAEALARLDFLRENHCPLGLLLGPAGSGKSAILAEFAARTVRCGTLIAAVHAAAIDEPQLLARLAIGLCLDCHGDERLLGQRLTDRFEELKLENLSAIVLLDDFDRAAPAALGLVERLLAISDLPLTIVASARPETAGRLGSRLLEQAALRIDLAPWTETETREYLDTSLSRAGRAQPAFAEAGAQRLFELSGGAPRRVNQLAQLALLAGAGQELSQIDAETIDAVHEELSMAR